MMQLIRDVPTKKMKPCVAAIGNFDGLHLGHQEIIHRVVAKAQSLQLTPTVITFEPAPRVFLRPQEPLYRLTTLAEKLRILKAWGIEQVVCLRFNASLAQLSAEHFISIYLADYLQIRYLMVGEDFRFGFKRMGTVALLEQAAKQFGFTVEPFALKQCAAQKISSTAIRQALQQGNFPLVKSLLGRDYALSVTVIKGRQLGRELGFPTANFFLHPKKVPFKGVFITRVEVEGKIYQGVANVGTRPTVDGQNQIGEVHLFDFTGDLYAKSLTVTFVQKIRDEAKFANIGQLQQQIEKDVHTAKLHFINQLEGLSPAVHPDYFGTHYDQRL